MRRSPGKASRSVLVIAAALAVFVVAAAPGATARSTKRVGVDVTPHDVPGGSTQTFTIVMTNKAALAHVGSADITAPASFSVLSASTPQGTATISGQVISFDGLDVPPDGTLSVEVVAKLGCTPKTATWDADVFQVGSGSIFDLTAASDLSTTISGDCTLVFLKQPADAAVGQPITNVDVDPTAGPVKVAFYDGNGDKVEGSSAPITIAIGSNPGGGTLSGTTTQSAVDGVASFDDLSIDLEGDGYTLVASSPGFTSATSDPFNIVGDGEVCTGSGCSATTTDGTTTVTVNTRGTGIVEVSLGDDGLDCADYTEVTATMTFSSTTDFRKKITAVVGPPLARPKSQGRFEVCYSSGTPFIDKSGELVTTGLLAHCRAARPNPPCVVSVTYGTDAVTVVFLAPAGDPKGRL